MRSGMVREDCTVCPRAIESNLGEMGYRGCDLILDSMLIYVSKVSTQIHSIGGETSADTVQSSMQPLMNDVCPLE